VVTYLPVSQEGIVDLVALKESLRPETVLVSVMSANNEIGTIQPIREVAKILREWRKSLGGISPLLREGGVGVVEPELFPTAPDLRFDPALVKAGSEMRLPYFHTDACQAPRFLSLTVEKLGVDLLTLNGSKIYGPKGIGCLYVKRNTFMEPIIYGGGQERGLRSGTENVPGAVGLATALLSCEKMREKESEKLLKLRDYFIKELTAISGARINGSLIDRLPNNINVSFPGVLGEWLVLSLDTKGIACSTGSACSTHHKDDAHVIMALGHDKSYAESTVRFSLDRMTTKKDIDYTLKSIKEILAKNIIS
jgi:cysteine desulfurase